MPHKLLHPQEIEVYYALPTLRRELAIAMKEEGMDQKQIARLLSVTEAAVSQYMNLKRGMDISLTKATRDAVRASAHRVIQHQETLVEETTKLLRLLWQARSICALCHEYNHTPQSCNACFEGEVNMLPLQ